MPSNPLTIRVFGLLSFVCFAQAIIHQLERRQALNDPSVSATGTLALSPPPAAISTFSGILSPASLSISSTDLLAGTPQTTITTVLMSSGMPTPVAYTCGGPIWAGFKADPQDATPFCLSLLAYPTLTVTSVGFIDQTVVPVFSTGTVLQTTTLTTPCSTLTSTVQYTLPAPQIQKADIPLTRRAVLPLAHPFMRLERDAMDQSSSWNCTSLYESLSNDCMCLGLPTPVATVCATSTTTLIETFDVLQFGLTTITTCSGISVATVTQTVQIYQPPGSTAPVTSSMPVVEPTTSSIISVTTVSVSPSALSTSTPTPAPAPSTATPGGLNATTSPIIVPPTPVQTSSSIMSTAPTGGIPSLTPVVIPSSSQSSGATNSTGGFTRPTLSLPTGERTGFETTTATITHNGTTQFITITAPASNGTTLTLSDTTIIVSPVSTTTTTTTTATDFVTITPTISPVQTSVPFPTNINQTIITASGVLPSITSTSAPLSGNISESASQNITTSATVPLSTGIALNISSATGLDVSSTSGIVSFSNMSALTTTTSSVLGATGTGGVLPTFPVNGTVTFFGNSTLPAAGMTSSLFTNLTSPPTPTTTPFDTDLTASTNPPSRLDSTTTSVPFLNETVPIITTPTSTVLTSTTNVTAVVSSLTTTVIPPNSTGNPLFSLATTLTIPVTYTTTYPHIYVTTISTNIVATITTESESVSVFGSATTITIIGPTIYPSGTVGPFSTVPVPSGYSWNPFSSIVNSTAMPASTASPPQKRWEPVRRQVPRHENE